MKIVEQDIKTIIEQVGLPIMDFEGSEVLISGACGFLGSWFVAVFDTLNKNYFKKPCYVYCVDSMIAADQENSIVKVHSPYIKYRADDIAAMQFGPTDKVDYIIHAAGIASPIYYRKYPIETIEGMVMGLSNLLKFSVANGIRSFLNFSSSEMYGNPHPEAIPTPETYNGNVSATGPRSCYDESKRMTEAMCVAYHRVHNVPVKWVRPFNISGPGMRRRDDRVLPKFIYAGIDNKPVEVHLPGLQTRTLTYITDGMVGFLKALLIGKNGDVYNIGRDQEEISIVDLANKVSKVGFNGRLKVNTIECPTEYPQDQALRRCPDITKARQDLQYDPRVNLDTIIKRTVEWAAL